MEITANTLAPNQSARTNDKLEVRPSTLHGRGVFAKVSFQTGEVVVAWESTKEISEAEFNRLDPAVKRFTDIRDGKMFLVGEPERYVNHSCDHNTFPGAKGDIALRDIAPGEEITTNYENFFILAGFFECVCERPNCRKIIRGLDVNVSLKPKR